MINWLNKRKHLKNYSGNISTKVALKSRKVLYEHIHRSCKDIPVNYSFTGSYNGIVHYKVYHDVNREERYFIYLADNRNDLRWDAGGFDDYRVLQYAVEHAEGLVNEIKQDLINAAQLNDEEKILLDQVSILNDRTNQLCED